MPDQRIRDHKGLVIRYWNTYLKQFYKDLSRRRLYQDLQQEIEAIAHELKVTDTSLGDAGKLFGKRFREFLKSINYRKRNGYWTRREYQRHQTWWKIYAKTNCVDRYDRYGRKVLKEVNRKGE